MRRMRGVGDDDDLADDADDEEAEEPQPVVREKIRRGRGKTTRGRLVMLPSFSYFDLD